MDNFYSSPPYTYLPPASTAIDHAQMYRGSHTYERNSPLDNDYHNQYDHTDSNHHCQHQQDPIVPDPYNSWSNHTHSAVHTPTLYSPNCPSVAPVMCSPRPKVTTNFWEDEGTACFQVDAKGVCVARRQDNDMINGTKLLNVAGMSRGKRDGILKNEKGRVVVKVGAMHLKGVWIPFNRARELAIKFKIMDVLFPLFADEPAMFGYSAASPNQLINETGSSKCNTTSPSLSGFHHRVSEDYSSINTAARWNKEFGNHNMGHQYTYSNDLQHSQLFCKTSHSDLSATTSPVPQSLNHAKESPNNDIYLLHNEHNNNSSSNNASSTNPYVYYYSRPSFNRNSFSSTVSNQHSYTTYPPPPSLQHENLDTNNHLYKTPYHHQKTTHAHHSPYTSLPYPTSKTIDTSAGSTTPSSWLSPETPTAVLFQQKEELSPNKKRKSSYSAESPSKRVSLVESNLLKLTFSKK
ncbi:hypothetical protein EDC96DRAFT_589071 [Choanephora cucurbitarum]|nr:hypothetical protein EDC96DRAFT_589071 [Choanephora cucurbitarum]